jgi:hypothetical protein
LPTPAGIGCVPYFTDRQVATALGGLGRCCVVVDKQQPRREAVELLAQTGVPLSSAYLEGFEELAVPDQHGAGPIIHPYSGPLDPVDLGPVRVAGWKAPGQGERPRPLLHSKLLVLGVTTYYEDDEEFAGEIMRFTPTRTWMGSANWTYAARKHIEFGLWSTDPALVNRNYQYLLDLLRFSEPRTAMTIGPTPELVPATWDNAAFYEYFAEQYEEPSEEDNG